MKWYKENKEDFWLLFWCVIFPIILSIAIIFVCVVHDVNEQEKNTNRIIKLCVMYGNDENKCEQLFNLRCLDEYGKDHCGV